VQQQTLQPSKVLIFFQSIVAFLLVVSHVDSYPDYEPPYGEKLNPKPFQYEYGLESARSGAAFSKKEAQVMNTLKL
jgi:hypothetical protein